MEDLKDKIDKCVELSKVSNTLRDVAGVFTTPVSIESFPEAKPYLRACREAGASIFEVSYKKWRI